MASVKRLVPRATAVPRPAKLARQIRQGYLAGPRAYQDCRAGFAGRDTQVVRAPGAPLSPPDPTQDAVLG